MITKQELQKVKEQRKTNLYYEEKEYLQYIFLNAISRYSEKIIFKGGTCLRICFGLERASEDLDFSTELNTKEIKEIIYKCLKDFELLNITYEISAEKKFKENIRFEIRFRGPLFNGNLNSSNILKIDFNNQKIKNKQSKVIDKLFSDVPVFVISVLPEKEILAEKIRALINRSAPKDLYDLWFLFSKNTEIDKKLINKKLKQENSKYSDLKIPLEKEYNIALKNLVNFLPDYNQVKKEILEKLNKVFEN